MRKRGLTPEDEALWREVARSVTPMRKRKKAPPDAARPPAAATGSRLEADPKATKTPRPTPSVPGAAPAKRTPARLPSPLAAGDPKLDRKARAGRIAVERTLDLHGMTQARAEARLLVFLEEARADDVRCVRVITGKGGPAEPFAAPRGVLRRRFLDWIEAAPFRPLIARVASAEPRAATPGAWIVFLKSRPRGRRSS